jgi:hypothetical protein
MARIRADLYGSVLVTLPGSSDPIALTAGQEVPEGIEVGDHVLEPGSGSTTPASKSSAPANPAGTDDAAKAAAKAQKKAAKKASKGEPPASVPTPPAAAAPAGAAGDELVPPPLNGAGSAAPAWRDYAIKAVAAAGLEIDIPEDAKRGDIVDALKSAGIRTE